MPNRENAETNMDKQLQFREFIRSDFAEYRRWYLVDEQLDHFLGPMEADDPWLTAVMAPDPGEETISAVIKVMSEQILAAVVNIAVDENGCAIPAIATNPDFRGRGFGHQTLDYLAGRFKKLIVHVDQENSRALEFFADHGFIRQSENDGMVTLEFEAGHERFRSPSRG